MGVHGGRQGKVFRLGGSSSASHIPAWHGLRVTFQTCIDAMPQYYMPQSILRLSHERQWTRQTTRLLSSPMRGSGQGKLQDY